LTTLATSSVSTRKYEDLRAVAAHRDHEIHPVGDSLASSIQADARNRHRDRHDLVTRMKRGRSAAKRARERSNWGVERIAVIRPDASPCLNQRTRCDVP
jgi:hypothetical protein